MTFFPIDSLQSIFYSVAEAIGFHERTRAASVVHVVEAEQRRILYAVW